MNCLLRPLELAASLALLIPVCGFSPDAAQKPAADMVVTAAPAYDALAALKGGERFPKGAQLLLVHEGKPEPLAKGFAVSADANVSFDGKRVLFAGKQAAGDPWQIWEMTLVDRSVRKVTATGEDAVRPFYLPGGRLVYAQRKGQRFELEAAGKDGAPVTAALDSDVATAVLPLAYLPASAVPADVLADGRILFEAGYPLGTGSTPELYLVYSDGSGVESYRCDHGTTRWGGHQLASGDVVFTKGNGLARFSSPMATEARVTAPRGEFAGQIAETESGAWLVSARAGAGAHYALKLWKPGAAAMQTLVALPGADLVEPVLIAAHERPKRHPSGLHDWNYANLLALDARLSREGDLKTVPASVRLEMLDEAGHAVVAGSSPVDQDGSFFVKVPADKPIRFALLDGKGAVVRQEHGWFWIRRGEQRICVGCHTGPERASENHVPAVLLRTTTPVDLSGATSTDVAKSAAQGGK